MLRELKKSFADFALTTLNPLVQFKKMSKYERIIREWFCNDNLNGVNQETML
jgi:hypothetical protein